MPFSLRRLFGDIPIAVSSSVGDPAQTRHPQVAGGRPLDQHVRWMIAASASVAVGHAAMDAAIANYPEHGLR